jgi:dihydrofolate reductase
MILSIIVAVAENQVIGHNNQLLWHISEDLKRFKSLTLGHHIIMGRKTFESIGRPLPGRTNIVITRRADFGVEGCLTAHSLQEAIALAESDSEAFVIGGGEIYSQAIPLAQRIYLTRVHAGYAGDTIFPELNMAEWATTSVTIGKPADSSGPGYSFINLERVR